MSLSGSLGLGVVLTAADLGFMSVVLLDAPVQPRAKATSRQGPPAPLELRAPRWPDARGARVSHQR